MSVGMFTDKKVHPSEADIEQAVGYNFSLWQALLDDTRDTYPVEEDVKFMYGKNYGWARRFRVRGQLLTSLYPCDGGFKVQVNLPPDAVETALSMNLGANARQAIDNANPYPEGRWLFVPVESAADLEDVKRLIALRVQAKRLLKNS